MSILGNRVLRREDPKLLTSGGTYVGDLDIPDALSVSFVRSTIAHGRIQSIDLAEAKAAPGPDPGDALTDVWADGGSAWRT